MVQLESLSGYEQPIRPSSMARHGRKRFSPWKKDFLRGRERSGSGDPGVGLLGRSDGVE